MDLIMELGMENLVDIIKIFFICIFILYVNFRLINKIIKINFKYELVILLSMICVSIIWRIIKNILGFSYGVIFIIFFIAIIFKILSKESFAYSLLVTIISSSINYSVFCLSVIISVIPTILCNIQNIYVGLFLILLLYLVCLYFLSRIKRLKKGVIFLQKKNDYMEIISLNISVVILFCTLVLSSYDKIVSRKAYVSMVILSIIMFITIQKSLQLYYKQKLQERETEALKEELENKKKEIKELEEENLKLNKINHSIAHKQKSLEYELNQLLIKNDITNTNNIKEEIEEITKEMQTETTKVELAKTGINEIDNMLIYMQSECIKNKIDFELQINGNIHQMINKYITKQDLEILIADHIKNAIIAILHSKNINKNILVRLGLIDGYYSLYIYDSGIEFEIKTLINLGETPSTTHANDGGTGMGFMNTFDTLRKYKASIMIHEYGKPAEDNFTKLIKIIFDHKYEYKISSYREKEIKEKDIKKRISFLN